MKPITGPRINYYIEGIGGVGKGLMSKAIARALIDVKGDMYDDDIFFETGSDKVSFEGYDGQPVIIWNDCRAGSLIHKLGGRENVFNVFDPFPPNIQQNVKYGSVRLNNTINIVNSIQPWESFLDGLAGSYVDRSGNIHDAEDPSQSYRRFPFFLVVHEDDYELGVNKGMLSGTREFVQYWKYQGIRGGMRRIADRCGNNVELYNAVTKQVVQPVITVHSQMVDKLEHKQQGTDEEILAEFSDVGKTNTPNAELTSVGAERVNRDINALKDAGKL
jgi:hypothetical protein